MEEIAEALRPYINNISDLEAAMKIILGDGCGVIVQGMGEIWITTGCLTDSSYEIIRVSDNLAEEEED
jgi:hypothetical protein